MEFLSLPTCLGKTSPQICCWFRIFSEATLLSRLCGVCPMKWKCIFPPGTLFSCRFNRKRPADFSIVGYLGILRKSRRTRVLDGEYARILAVVSHGSPSFHAGKEADITIAFTSLATHY